MHAERIDSAPECGCHDVSRLVLLALLTSDHSPWSHTELQREIVGSDGHPEYVVDAINDLYAAGLIHVSGHLITPTRAARVMDELRL